MISRITVLLSLLITPALASQLPALPEPVANNAVAIVSSADKKFLLSFMGLGKNKGYQDVHNKAWQLKVDNNGAAASWTQIPPVPSSLSLKGRLASIAVGVKDKAYIFGGYTVAADHSEISTPDVYSYDPVKQTYQLLAAMPVPVDDAVALVYQQRYIYLISGWHNDGNVNLVQVYDTETNSWAQASPYLGAPVFGHAGGIVGNKMLICDGVATIPRETKRRTFAAETACYRGEITPQDHHKINWFKVPHPTGISHYRMAASGVGARNQILFVGGSDNPYNYNGVGYNGAPSEPSQQAWVYLLDSQKWEIRKLDTATMDHRGLILLNNKPYVIGGMGLKQQVLAEVTAIDIN